MAAVPGAAMQAMQRDLAHAGDAQVLQVLRYVDQLPDADQAERLRAPLRDKLRRLRPPRPLRFTRLLFLPAEPAFVPASDWRASRLGMPRAAVRPLAALVRAALGDDAAALEAVIGGTALPLALRTRRAGLALWPRAAETLRCADAPAAWDGTALPAGSFRQVALGAAACLGAARELYALADPGVPARERNDRLERMLAGAARDGPLAWGMLLAVVLQRFPDADAWRHVLGAGQMSAAMRPAAEAAQAAGWRWLERSAAKGLGLGALADAADEVRRQAVWLDAMALAPQYRQRALEMRGALRAALLARLRDAVQHRLVAPMQALKASPADKAMCALEDDARSLRRLEAELRRLGDMPVQPSPLRAAAAIAAAQLALAPIDRARLVEILAAPPSRAPI